MTSSTEPEVHCRQKRTEPRPQVPCTENLVTFGHVVLTYTSGQTNRQTDMLITILRTSDRRRVTNTFRIPAKLSAQRTAVAVHATRVVSYFRSYLFNSLENSKNKYYNITIVRWQLIPLLFTSHKHAKQGIRNVMANNEMVCKLLNNTV